MTARFTISLLFAPLMISCTQGFRAAGVGDLSLASTSCKISAGASTISTFGTPSQKGLAEFETDKLQVSGLNEVSTQGVGQDVHAVATIDKACLRTSENLKTAALQINDRGPASTGLDYGLVTLPVTLNAGMTVADLRAALADENCVVGVSDDVTMKLQAMPNDSRLSEQTYLNTIAFDTSYDFFKATWALKPQQRVLIAVIDDGINLTHPDLAPVLWENSAEKNGQAGVDDDGNGYIDDVNGYNFASAKADPSHESDVFHGTHVSGLAAASSDNATGISGVMTGPVRVMALNIFGASDSTGAALIDEAIRYAADNGANVINMSLGGRGRAASTRVALEYAISKGVTVVVAAGNDNTELNAQNFYTPASFAAELSGMVAVGATDASNSGNRCGFSNFSATEVEIAAPGCDAANPQGLLSTLTGNTYNRYNGTSMASPIVAGAAATAFLAIRDRVNANPTPATMEQVLVASSRVQDTLNTSIKGGRHLNLKVMADLIARDYPINSIGNSCLAKIN